MPSLHNSKWERFCLNYFEGKSGKESAIIAGYKPSRAYQTASRLVRKGNILKRLQELQQAAANALIADVIERKQRLTVFVREDVYTKFGINRQGNIQAIVELNKMEKIYEINPVVQDNRVINIIVVDNETKDLIGKVGERTSKLLG